MNNTPPGEADEWHIEVVSVSAVLRRYSGQDALTAYLARKPYDAVMSAELRDGVAHLSAALVSGREFNAADRRAIVRLLRSMGAVSVVADRHGKGYSFSMAPKSGR